MNRVAFWLFCALLFAGGILAGAPDDEAIRNLSPKEIIATVEHLQRLVKSAEQKQTQAEERAGAAIVAMTDAQTATIAAKSQITSLERDIEMLAADRDTQQKRAEKSEARVSTLARRCWWLTGALVLCVLWITRGLWTKLL